MRKNLKSMILIPLFICAIFLIAQGKSAYADVNAGTAKTNVKGFVGQNTTWTEAKSPYYITSKVTVAEGATLTIEPGVTVYFADESYDCDLKVYGNLVLKGTKDKNITFRYANENVKGKVIFTNANNMSIEYLNTNVEIIQNGNDNSIVNSQIGNLYIAGNNNKLINSSTVSNYSYAQGFSITGNNNMVSKCILKIYSGKGYKLIDGSYNKINKSDLYLDVKRNDGYVDGFDSYDALVFIKGNYNKLIQNNIRVGGGYNGKFVIEQNNNMIHHNNFNGNVKIVSLRSGFVNFKGNYNTQTEVAVKNSTPVILPKANNSVDINQDIDIDEEAPVLKNYTVSKTEVAIDEDITLSVIAADDSNIFAVFLVKDESSDFVNSNRFTYDEKTDTYNLKISYDKAGVQKLPTIAIIDDFNNIAYIDPAKHENGKYDKSITVGDAKPSSNANLKAITINNIAIADLASGKTSYALTLPKTTLVDKLNVAAVPEDSNSKVVVTGDTLVNGISEVNIEVTSQDGTVIKYKIIVSKESDVIVPVTGGIKGDVNGDGKVTIMDAVKIAKYIIGLETLTDEQKKLADYNGDGKVTIMDAQAIAKFVVEK